MLSPQIPPPRQPGVAGTAGSTTARAKRPTTALSNLLRPRYPPPGPRGWAGKGNAGTLSRRSG
eukprot:1289680-Lingulodinium_polyedra.AAC.1